MTHQPEPTIPGLEPEPELTWASPSRILDRVLNPGERALRWAWKAGRDGILLGDAKRRSTKGGLSIHDAIERVCKVAVPPHPNDPVGFVPSPLDPLHFDPGARGAAEAFNVWWDGRRPIVVACEQRLSDRQLMLRGNVDLVIECPGCPYCIEAGRVGHVIVDFKTGWVDDPKSHLQVGGFYRWLWEPEAEARNAVICDAVLVGLSLNGREREPVEIPCQADVGDAQQALAFYRLIERIGAGALDEIHGAGLTPPRSY